MAILDLGYRALFQLQGPDAVRYLNGQVTQDVRLLFPPSNRALPSCVTDAKGRLQAYVNLCARAHETIWIEAPLEQRDSLFARLSRYLIADDAEISDISEDWRLLHLIDEPSIDGDFSSHRLGIAGWDRWIAADAALPDGAMMSADEAEEIRVSHGQPAWGRELTEGMLPPEAGLDAHAISYQKGCYIGQEVISRIKSAGKVNRRLACFELSSSHIALPKVLLSHEGEEIGVITSIAGTKALGYLHKKAFEKKEFVIDDSSNATARMTRWA
jgi:folate-binding protein YgfZ